MNAWHYWVIGGLLLALAELLGLGFFALALGLACLAGAVAALAGASFALQLFCAGVAGAILAPTLTRALRKTSRSNRFASLAGEEHPQSGILTLDPQGQLRLRLEGDLYPVRSLGERPLAPGETVVVRRFDGITALVD